MKKSVNPMDQLFKDTFESASDPVDQEALWPYVEQNLPEKEPSRGFFLYFLSGLILLLLALAGWIWTRDGSVPMAQEEKEIDPDTQGQASIVKSSQLPQKESSASDLLENSSALSESVFDTREAKGQTMEGFVKQASAAVFTTAFDPLEPLGFPSLKTSRPPNKLSSVQLDDSSDPKWSRCSDKRSSRPGFLIEGFVFGGLPLISNRWNDNTDIDYGNYLASWNQSETGVSTFSAGLLIGLETQWGGSISAGLEYQKIQNRLNQEQRIIERITVYDEMAYFFIDSNNNRVYVADSVTTSRTYTRELQTAKTHTLINIPVLLGYHRQIGKFRYGIIGGVNFHLRNEFKGKALDASGQIIDAGSDSPNAIYRKDLNMSIIGGIDAGYMIGEGLEVYLSPRFRFQGDSWLRSDHPLVSRIQLVGLQAGVRLHL
ncbi:MAG: hypothetical protein GVX78_00760 [Bacteroidetes bacterium]|jgi:hypothetical protein|nr:hypothetical protein [Bacteroidota bacterium]